MKKLTLSASLLTLLLSASYAQNFEMVSFNEEAIVINHELSTTPFEIGVEGLTTIESLDYWNFSKSHKIVTMEAGAPSIPFFTESVIIPNSGALSLDITHDGYTEYTDVLISPSKGSLKRNILPESVPYTFGEAYETDAFYPGEIAQLTEAFILRTTRGVTVVVNPFQYNPVTKVLRVYKNVQATVLIDGSETGLNELTLSADHPKAFMDVYKNMYLNANSAFGRYTPREEEGDMLIISSSSLVDEIEPLAVWKTQEGIRTTIVEKSFAGDSDVEIKAYIQDFYAANPNLVFVLFVGDHAQVPSHTYGYSGGEQLWSDSYYGQMTGDFYPELFVGRFSGTSSDVSIMVKRTLEYEKTPATGEWMTRGIGLASNEGSGYGDDGEADWQHARNNRAKLLDYGYTEVLEFYDGSQGGADASGNPNASMINPEVEEGVGLFNYTGHGDLSTCITGNYSSSNINSADNEGKYPFVISVACNNGTFTSGTCISEVWLNARNGSNPTGAIAACGSTILMAWAEPMETQDEMTNLIAGTHGTKATLGGIFYNAQMSMLEDYGVSSTAKEVMQTWVMFGDPSVLFRNQVTENMEVTHWWIVPQETSSITATVAVEGATAAIVQDGILLGSAKVVGGSATVEFTEITSDEPLLLTITKQNYKPYQAVIRVADGPAGIEEENANAISVFPNPATEQFTVNWNTSNVPSAITVSDLSGKVVYNSQPVSGTNETIDVNAFAPGVYLLNVTIDGETQVSKVVVR